MDISTQSQEGKLIIRPREERLDAHTSKDLKEFILQSLEDGHHRVVVNLSDVRFIDSQGLNALWHGHQKAELQADRFVLACLHDQVRQMFEMTGLSRMFEIYETVEEALAAL